MANALRQVNYLTMNRLLQAEEIMRPKLRIFCFVMFAMALACSSSVAETQEDKTQAPYFFVQGDPTIDHLPLKDTRVQIDIAGVGIAKRVDDRAARSHARAAVALGQAEGRGGGH